MIELNLKLISNIPTKSVYLPSASLRDVHSFILNNFKWNPDNYYLRSNGKEVLRSEDIYCTVQVIPKLRGGKGGFGSMLRAIGAQIEKTTNREACRDLSGRRLRDINEEQRLKKWISQQAEREREILERKKKKLEKLSTEPKHEFQDDEYFAERSELPEKLNDALEQGIQAASSNSSVKRKAEEVKPIIKKKKLLIDFDEFSSSEGSDKEESDGGSDGGGECSLNIQGTSSISKCKNVDQKQA
ncbi:splicing regulator SDE2 [Rhodnius prolixus]